MLKEAIAAIALAPELRQARLQLALHTARTFREVGINLNLAGHLVGADRESGASPFGHGNDATVAVSLLLRIASELVSGSAGLISDDRVYAGSALVRQLVEVEYLAWAFETKSEEAARWLRSSRTERQSFFTPAKLRKAAAGRFRSVDYGFHCQFGGHPVPGSWQLFEENAAMGQLMLSDCLGHAGRIWDHILGWSKTALSSELVAARADEMLAKYSDWKRADLLTRLPPPPAEFLDE